jgi:hypothetical protein
MLDIQEIRDHACKTADAGLPDTECPYDDTSLHGQMWLDYYFTRVRWLSGEMSE